jgi:hypothetical protein
MAGCAGAATVMTAQTGNFPRRRDLKMASTVDFDRLLTHTGRSWPIATGCLAPSMTPKIRCGRPAAGLARTGLEGRCRRTWLYRSLPTRACGRLKPAASGRCRQASAHLQKIRKDRWLR